MSRLNAMMEQYKTNATPSKPKQASKKFDENNYFGTRLNDGVNSAQQKVRIVEPKGETESPFVEIMGHKKKLTGNGEHSFVQNTKTVQNVHSVKQEKFF